eukprot:gene15873-18864_t
MDSPARKLVRNIVRATILLGVVCAYIAPANTWYQSKLSVHQPTPDNTYGHYIVQFTDTINDHTRANLEHHLSSDASGQSKIVGYYPIDSFHVVMLSEVARRLDAEPYIHWVGKYDTTHKIHLNSDLDRVTEPLGRVSLTLVTNHYSPSQIDQLVNRWSTKLNNILENTRATMSLKRVTGDSTSHLLAVVSCANGVSCDLLRNERAAYQWISKQHESLSIERIMTSRTANRYAPTITLAKSDSALLPIDDYSKIPLRGAGQIIGCADTGIDLSHCFFSDQGSLPLDGTVDMTQRKVVSYTPLGGGDTKDYQDGHGSHVVGSLVGLSSNISHPTNKYRGVAYDAKVAFVDISSKDASVVDAPENLAAIYDKVYSIGARVHADSWGSHSTNGYDAMYGGPSQQLDAFIYGHQDMLIVRAAGNEGDVSYQSLLTPAVAKNVLTVGAQQSSPLSFADVTTTFSKSVVDPFLSSGLNSACSFDAKYCAYTTAQCCAELGTTKGLSACCDTFIANATKTVYTQESLYNSNNMASFSSRGPTHDGRVKPDIVAPGLFVISARSNGNVTTDQCGDGSDLNDSLLAEGGTSMATPHAAAAALILRQYFIEGYFPQGAPNASNAMAPSAALLKAVIINSAARLNGTMIGDKGSSVPVNTDTPVTGASQNQGWGAMKLGNVLHFQSISATPPQWIGIAGLQEVKQGSEWKEPKMSTGQNTSYCIKYTDNGGAKPTIKATLVWSDPPAAPGAAFDLVNNLDLQLRVVNTITPGNAGNNPAGGGALADTLNNVEQIEVTKGKAEAFYFESGTVYKFTVLGKSVPMGPQNYSLVISGVDGQFDWAETCTQCGPGEIMICNVNHGIGTAHCTSDLLWGTCIVNTCDQGYSYSSLTNTCTAFLDYNYVIMIVAGITMALLFLLVGIIKYFEYKEIRKRDDGSNSLSIKHKPKDSKVTIPDLYSLVSPFIIRLLFSAACSLVGTSASILQPIYIGQIIQKIPTTESISDLNTTFVIIFVLAIVEFLFTTLSSWVSGIVSELMIMSIQGRIFRSIMGQDMGFFTKNNAPTLINVLIVDGPMLRSALAGILLGIGVGICKLVGSLAFMFQISWKLSMAFFATIPVLAAVTGVQAKFTKKLTRTLLYYSSKASQHGSESMVNMQVVANYCKQEKEITKYSGHLNDVYLTARRLIIANTLAGSIKWLMVETLAFTILYYGSYLSINKEFSVGLLISFSLYVGYVVDSAQSLFGIYISYVQCLASAHRVFMILRSAPRKRTTLEEEQADLLEKEETSGASKDDKTFSSSEDINNNNTIIGETTPGVSNNNNVGGDDVSTSTPTATDDLASNAELTKKELKKKKKKEQDQFYKQTGITVYEMNALPQTFVDLNDVKGEIEFKNVSFRYPTRPDVQVLSNINFKLEPGKCYGLVGPSGSGKSTCLELMAKFYQLKEGKIFLDGTDINKIRPSNLRSNVTVVHQSPFLFDSTVAQNIGYSLDEPTIEEVIEASKMANAHEFIVELPNQYDTQLGQSGSLLSGGQKKRIAVARAICAKRKIMLLDEITAELDPESEHAITNSIKKLTQGHTVVMVAHKIAAVKDCHKIFVLEKGHLVEEGTHTELMDRKGRYFKMFSNKEDDESMELPIADICKSAIGLKFSSPESLPYFGKPQKIFQWSINRVDCTTITNSSRSPPTTVSSFDYESFTLISLATGEILETHPISVSPAYVSTVLQCSGDDYIIMTSGNMMVMDGYYNVSYYDSNVKQDIAAKFEFIDATPEAEILAGYNSIDLSSGLTFGASCPENGVPYLVIFDMNNLSSQMINFTESICSDFETGVYDSANQAYYIYSSRLGVAQSSLTFGVYSLLSKRTDYVDLPYASLDKNSVVQVLYYYQSKVYVCIDHLSSIEVLTLDFNTNTTLTVFSVDIANIGGSQFYAVLSSQALSSSLTKRLSSQSLTIASSTAQHLLVALKTIDGLLTT